MAFLTDFFGVWLIEEQRGISGEEGGRGDMGHHLCPTDTVFYFLSLSLSVSKYFATVVLSTNLQSTSVWF